jgi:hypothetical protein
MSQERNRGTQENHIPPRFTFIGGVFLFLLDISIQALDYFHRLAYLKEELPGFYVWLVGPTVMFGLILLGVVLMIAGLVEMRKGRLESPPRNAPKTATPESLGGKSTSIQQQTHGLHSPAIGSIRDIGAGANVIIGGAPPSVPPIQPRPAPRLLARHPRHMTCQFPVPDERFIRMPMDCVVLGVRNSADSSTDEADNVIAHLKFESDTSPTVHIDEAWWCEDEEDTGVHSFYIGRDETKHLVVAIKADREYFAVPKEFKSYHGRNMPGEAVALSVGRWRITVEITAEHVREKFYLEAAILEDGKSSWSDPATAPPSSWPATTA